MKELLARPLPWALVSGAALLLALSLRPRAPSWLFWGLAGLSCVGAALLVRLDPEDD